MQVEPLAGMQHTKAIHLTSTYFCHCLSSPIWSLFCKFDQQGISIYWMCLLLYIQCEIKLYLVAIMWWWGHTFWGTPTIYLKTFVDLTARQLLWYSHSRETIKSDCFITWLHKMPLRHAIDFPPEEIYSHTFCKICFQKSHVLCVGNIIKRNVKAIINELAMCYFINITFLRGR